MLRHLPLVVLAMWLYGCGSCNPPQEEGRKDRQSAISKAKKRRAAKAKKRKKRQAEIDKLMKDIKVTKDEKLCEEGLRYNARQVQAVALKRLEQLKSTSPEAIKSSIPLLASRGPLVRKYALSTLKSMGEPAVQPLIDQLHSKASLAKAKYEKDGKKHSIRREIRRTLAAMGEPAVPGLIKALESDDYLQKTSAVMALGNMTDEKALDALDGVLKLTEDEDMRVRKSAILNAVKMAPEDKKVKKMLTKIGKDENEEIKAVATSAVELQAKVIEAKKAAAEKAAAEAANEKKADGEKASVTKADAKKAEPKKVEAKKAAPKSDTPPKS